MARAFPVVYRDACHELGAEYRDLAKLYGVSLRTVQRRYGRPVGRGIIAILKPLLTKNPALARELAEAAGVDLAELGLVPPEPPPEPPAPPPEPEVRVEKVFVPTRVEPPPALREHADSVLLAGAHALNQMPESIRPALAAAFARAAELGVSVAGLAERLARSPFASDQAGAVADRGAPPPADPEEGV